MTDRYCGNCGHELTPNNQFCPNCGRPVHETAQVPTSEADVNVPSPPEQDTRAGEWQAGAPQEGRGRGRKVLVGCLAIFGVFFLLIVALAALGGGGDETAGGGDGEELAEEPRQQQEPVAEDEQGQQEQQSEQNQEQQAEQEEQEGPRARIGEAVRVGVAEWRVTNANRANQLTSDFGDSKNGNFVIVDFTFTNRSNEAVTLNSHHIVLVDSENRESEPDTDTFGYIDPDRDIFLNQVNPGVSKEGQVIFSVAPNASGFTLQLDDLEFWENKYAYVRLGF